MYRELSKLAKNKHIPICNNIKVIGKTAIAINLDVELHMPNSDNLDDGLYRSIGFGDNIYNKNTNYDIADFPEVDINFDNKPVKILTDNLNFVARAISNEETRYYLCGIYLQNETIVASDGHRLHLAGVEHSKSSIGVIIPSKAIYIILRLAKKTKSKCINITLSDDGSYSKIALSDDIFIITKNIDGTYPDYGRIIPQNYKSNIKIELKQFRAHFKRCKALSKTINEKIVKINISNNAINYCNEVLGIHNSTRDLNINLDMAYLLDSISGNLSYDLKNPTSPILITDNDRLAILMPMSGKTTK